MLNQGTLIALLGAASSVAAETVSVPAQTSNKNQPFNSYMSFSIEFSSFVDFAGNKSNPNTFSYNLLNNLGQIGGSKPYVRVGGNTQDFALYDASQTTGIIGIINPAHSPDYPSNVTIGPSFFESYQTWPGVKFSHGFNLGQGAKTAAGWKSLQDTAAVACKAFSADNLYTFEYGNEPDLFASAAFPVRQSGSWNEALYVSQWQNGTQEIYSQFVKSCPDLANQGLPKFMAPSLSGANPSLKAKTIFQDWLDAKDTVELFSTHNYISGATSPGVTLQGTLMNHGRSKSAVDAQVANFNSLNPVTGEALQKHSLPLIFGEHNSLYNQGRPGLSNTFGAALWGLDFNLYAASQGFKRVHMHMGTNYRYQSWQPIDTDLVSVGTKAPYYGNIAVAASLGNVTAQAVMVDDLPLSSSSESAYAIYSASASGGNALARLTVLNMRGYNTTVGGEGIIPVANPPQRGSQTYTFNVSGLEGKKVAISRLLANGSDAITGITYDGWSYNYELKQGLPVRLNNVTFGETTTVKNGQVSVQVPDSSAAILSFQ